MHILINIWFLPSDSFLHSWCISHDSLLKCSFYDILLCSAPIFNIPFCRRWTLWPPTWTWKSAASLCCPGTERRTAAWTSCHQIAPWPSWSPQRGRVTITSMQLLLTASIGRLPSSWPLTLCRAPQRIFGGWFLITGAQQSSCSTSSTSRIRPGWGKRVLFFFIPSDLLAQR